MEKYLCKYKLLLLSVAHVQICIMSVSVYFASEEQSCVLFFLNAIAIAQCYELKVHEPVNGAHTPQVGAEIGAPNYSLV